MSLSDKLKNPKKMEAGVRHPIVSLTGKDAKKGDGLVGTFLEYHQYQKMVKEKVGNEMVDKKEVYNAFTFKAIEGAGQVKVTPGELYVIMAKGQLLAKLSPVMNNPDAYVGKTGTIEFTGKAPMEFGKFKGVEANQFDVAFEQ